MMTPISSNTGGALRAVSVKTGVPLDELCRLNGLGGNTALKAGWRIKLPHSYPAADESASICFASDSGKKSITAAYYRVIHGGTLREVAQKTGLSLSALCKLNRLRPDARLRARQTGEIGRGGSARQAFLRQGFLLASAFRL